MDWLYYILVPIIASIIGGAFSFGGIFITIKHENKIRKEDLKMREEEKINQTIDKNKKIISFRPELTLTDNTNNIKVTDEICLLPFTEPELSDEKTITFGYGNDIFNEEYWDKYEIILQNTGKRTIDTYFLQVPYKTYANIYHKFEIKNWKKSYRRNYYSDELLLSSNLRPDEKIKVIVYYPKNCPMLDDVTLDMYMGDEDGNYWLQEKANAINKINSHTISPDAFRMHLNSEYNYWFVYDELYYDDRIAKYFRTDISNMLEDRKQNCWEKEEKQEQFIRDINNGNKLLNTKLPLN